MQVSLNATDSEFLSRAIEISRHALEDEGKTPFGAIIVIDNTVIAEGTSSVVELMDPTAHAEVMALRNAGRSLQRHIMTDATMYASSEPCPMCLVACYWGPNPQARIRRVEPRRRRLRVRGPPAVPRIDRRIRPTHPPGRSRGR